MTNDHTRHHGRNILPATVSCALLSGCAAQPDVVVDFAQYDVVIGSAPRQTVVTGFLLEGPLADLAVLTIDENGDRHVRVHAFDDDTWASTLDAVLRPDVRFVDVAHIGGRDRLLTYGGGQLNWFDPASASERALATVACDFEPPTPEEIIHVDITHDVNDDDRDDLVVPDIDGFWVFVQGEDGTFADPVQVGSRSKTGRVYGADAYRYDPWGSGRVHQIDYDLDGRSDLVFWNDDHFEVHLQNDRGLFNDEAVTFTTEVAFDSDEIAALVAPEGMRHRRYDHQPDGELNGRILDTLADFNGDGVADLAVFELMGCDLWHLNSAYEVHFGAPTPEGGIAFAPHVDTAIRVDGLLFEMERHDLDGDGQVDMMFTTLDPEFFRIVGMLVEAMLTRSVSMDLHVHRMDAGVYTDAPDAVRTVKSATPRRGGDRSYHAAVMIGDVNGDGRSDLFIGRSRKELRLFLGVPGPKLFDRRPQKMSVTMPRDEEYSWLVDLDKDGRQDVLMHHATEPPRVTLLIGQ